VLKMATREGLEVLSGPADTFYGMRRLLLRRCWGISKLCKSAY
jgi:hypothetical protein